MNPYWLFLIVPACSALAAFFALGLGYKLGVKSGFKSGVQAVKGAHGIK